MAIFDVNNDAAISLTAKLEKLHRSAFPLAVRGTLNDVAAETRLLAIKKAETRFTNRRKSFLKSFIIFKKSENTFDLKNMKSLVGIDGSKPKGSKVSDGLAKQETGGVVKSRKLLTMNQARISGSYGKAMQMKHRFRKIKINQLGEKSNSKYITIKKGGKTTVFDASKKKLTPVYHVRNTKKTHLRPRPFLAPATKLKIMKINSIYVANAEKQFKRLLK